MTQVFTSHNGNSFQNTNYFTYINVLHLWEFNTQHQLTCTVLYLLFHWSLLICSSIVFRERGIVMSQSLLSSQPITNNISNRCRSPPQYHRNKLIMVFLIHYLAVSNNHCSRFWVRIIKEKYLLVNKPLPKLHSGDTCLGPEGVPY